MKKQFLKTTSIKVYTTALATSLLLLTGFNPASASYKKGSTEEAKITFVGSENNLMTFNVNFNNKEDAPFLLELTDEFGNVLYQKKFSEKNFDKNIVLKNVGDKVKVNFAIKTAKNTVNQKFDINSQINTIEEIVVTKI